MIILIINDILKFVSDNSTIISIGTSCITSIATAIYVLYAIRLVKESRLLREQSFSPEIIIYVSYRSNNLTICVANIGNGIARDITFIKRNEKELTEYLEGFGYYIFSAGFWNGLKDFAPEQRFFVEIGPSGMYENAIKMCLPIIDVDYYDKRNNLHKIDSYTIDPFIYIDKNHKSWLVS